MEKGGEFDIGLFIKQRWSHKSLLIAGFALIVLFIISVIFLLIGVVLPFGDEVTLALVTILGISFLIESFYRLKIGTIYEIFYSAYIAIALILLAVLYWISYITDQSFGVFQIVIIVTHIIVFLYALLTVRHSDKLGFILVAYSFVVLITIVVFAYLYWTASFFGLGYLQFSECQTISTVSRSDNWFYFSSVTFYNLGYGDICPIMPLTRLLSQIQVALGVLINTILLGFIFWKIREINVEEEYLKRRAKRLGSQ